MTDLLTMLGIVVAGIATWAFWTRVIWPRIDAQLGETTPEHDNDDNRADDWPDKGMW